MDINEGAESGDCVVSEVEPYTLDYYLNRTDILRKAFVRGMISKTWPDLSGCKRVWVIFLGWEKKYFDETISGEMNDSSFILVEEKNYLSADFNTQYTYPSLYLLLFEKEH